MKTKTKNIIGWVLTGLLTVVFLGSGYGKFTASDEIIRQAALMGFSPVRIKVIRCFRSVVFFSICHTPPGVLGTLLLAAYMGGAIATHTEHQINVMPPIIVSCMVWITAFIRFPELSRRLLGKPF
jgi:hypothetical protein